jgi:hypothetical protein
MQIDFSVVVFSVDAVITLNQSQYNFTEGQPPFTVCIDVENNVSIQAQLALSIETQADTAGSNDFVPLNQEELVNASTCFEVIIRADSILEEEERFGILLESRDPRLLIKLSEAEIRITDSNSKYRLGGQVSRQGVGRVGGRGR